jgi:cellobiose phosphorylase
MKAAPLLAAILYALSIVVTGTFSLTAFLVFAVWFFAPSIAYTISRPRVRKNISLDAKQRAYLEDVALKTWRFFEHFSEEKEYYWMSDNYQQSPKKGLAKRTSPTNIAFSLAAAISAWYFGFITLAEALSRLDRCLAGVETAEKWKGHLYNWYDIAGLSPLEPRYVSSVDSGNLACYLIVAEAAIQDAISRPMAAFVQQGLPAISREAQREVSLCIGDDIFNAVYALGHIEDTGDSLSVHRGRLKAFLDAYAGWAEALCEFPAGRVNRYGELTQALRDSLRSVSTGEYGRRYHELLKLLPPIIEAAAADEDAEILSWVKRMERALSESYIACRRLVQRADRLCRRIRAVMSAMDFSALYDREKGLFSIGFDVRTGQLSDTHYDLLASEARQTSFIAIAKGDVPGKHWFRLARPLAVAGEGRVLLSWGGTMFEYFMPLIIMRSYDHTLLSETYQSALALQSAWMEPRMIPWGVSESGYYAFDLQMNYQYKAFGVPALGMKSGLVRETVVTPYAAALALQVSPAAALANLVKFEKMGAMGRYGFFEAVDYTPRRMQKGRGKRIVKSYMAHHQGMILASILNALQDGRLQTLFHSATIVRATEMLLKEKVPPRSIVLNPAEKQPEELSFADEIRAARTFSHLQGYPEAHFLSNGSYTVMTTQYGSGYSAWHGRLVTRFAGDCLRDAPGAHVYIRDAESGNVWSAALLPACVRADKEKVVFEPHKATFERAVGTIETTLEICVSPECDMEVRILDIHNAGGKTVRLSLCCAFSPALSTQRDFIAHPAFAELFIDTEADEAHRTVFAWRRGGEMYCGLKACGCDGAALLTDRAAIFGKSAVGAPAWTQPHAQGDVARALGVQCDISVPPGETRTAVFVIAAGETKCRAAECLASISSEEDARRVSHLAWTHSQVEMRYLKLKDMEATLFQRIASRTVLPVPPAAAPAGPISIGALWKNGISGDDPVILLYASDAANIETVRTVGKAMEYLRIKGLVAQLVIVYDGGGQYICPLRDRIEEIAQSAPDDRIRPLSLAHAEAADIAAAEAAACLILTDEKSLFDQLKTECPVPSQRAFERPGDEPPRARMPRQLRAFDNGIGGYMARGSEYCIDMAEGTPRPWCNLLVGETFGSIVSAGGGGYTWAENARTTRLTPFRNDPLRDIPGEGIFVRNDRTGEAFGIAANLAPSGAYRVTHGFGYTVFERHGGVAARAACFADFELPVKATLLSLEDRTGRGDGYSVYYFAEPALGEAFCGSVATTYRGGALRAFAAFGPAKEMFISIPGKQAAHTNSAFEFFGAPGENLVPQALKAESLSGRSGGGATLLALQARIILPPGEKRELLLLLGCADAQGIDDIHRVFGSMEPARERLEQTKAYWVRLTGSVRISTREKSLDTLVNGWLHYQTYASRLMGRTGYYQSGGAFGFRDQLQDMLALLYTDPGRCRLHLLYCAERQFVEGDVLHWWHEPTVGVRTRITDDKLFLVYAACEYERVTGDMAVFDEETRYLVSRCIPEGKCDIYESFEPGSQSESVFMHCVRALDSSLVFGEHGLPLMGGGDWNDGMNQVGEQGSGESVWLAFFLAETLRMFEQVCRMRGEEELSRRYAQCRDTLLGSVEHSAWDGEWYLRAFFDDGTPLGSSASPECRIDLISQAWAVLAGAPRARHAFDAAMERLVLREEGIIRLLWPPFDRWDKNPGYIRNYLPGVRENGGQYTHAAMWFIIAAVKLNRRDDALSLLRMVNPINHARTHADALKYRGEPYVVAADVYDAPGNGGRAGWTWYTGAAGWMFQAAVVHILGMRIERGELFIRPCVPDDFGAYTIEYRRGEARYAIAVDVQPGYGGDAWLSLDGGEYQKRLTLDSAEGVHIIRACWNPSGDDILDA